MQDLQTANASKNFKLPRNLVFLVIVLCVAPFLLNLFGVDFGTEKRVFDPAIDKGQITDAMFQTLAGSFTHTILEWSAFCTAIFTVILSFCHYYLKRQVIIPIIGMALFFAGCMDAFHTLAADRLISATAENGNLIPFTWAISRVFMALILIVGVGFLMLRQNRIFDGSFRLVIIVSAIFGLIAYAIITYCATSDLLPKTQFPDSTITRPWDVAPLGLFLLAWFFVFPKFHREFPSIFSHALLISLIPNIFTQLYMAFGSTALFDNYFNVSHFLKIIAYLVPFTGLILDYAATYKEAETKNLELERQNWVQTRLEELNQVMRGNQPLSTLVRNIIGYLAPNTGAKVGAIYLKEGDYYEMKAGYACQHEISKKFRLKESLIGQAAFEKKEFSIAKAPGDYVKIASGLGESLPRHIFVIPFVHDDTTIAVLELASLENFSEKQLELIRRAKESIAVNIQSALIRNEIKEIYLKSETQEDEIIQQQEELRQANKEFEVQAQQLEKQKLELERI